jgi:hypothetical protein
MKNGIEINSAPKDAKAAKDIGPLIERILKTADKNRITEEVLIEALKALRDCSSAGDIAVSGCSIQG